MNKTTDYTKHLCKEYCKFYKENQTFFKNEKPRIVKVDGKNSCVFEKDKKVQRIGELAKKNNRSTKEENEFKKLSNANNIPLLEIGNNLQQGGLLIVGMNPAGTDIEFYTEKNWKKSNELLDTDKIFFYYKDDDTSGYLKNIKNFATSCGYSDKFSVLDVFAVVQATQSVIVEDLKQKSSQYEQMFKIFIEMVTLLQPEIIVFANAYVSKLVLREQYYYSNIKEYLDEDEIKEINIIKSITENYVQSTWNDNFGGYDVTFICESKEHTAKAFFCSMLSGQRALDLSSRKSLAWLVRHAKKNNN